MARKGRLPHRCNGRHEGQRCLARLSFKPHPGRSDPPCPKCGSRLHWYVDQHRRRRKDHNRCDDSACLYLHPHQRYGPLCVNSNTLDEKAFER